MRKREFVKLLTSSACLGLVCMTAGGGCAVGISKMNMGPFLVEVVPSANRDLQEETVLRQTEEVFAEFLKVGEEDGEDFSDEVKESVLDAGTKSRSFTLEEKDMDSAGRLNLAYYYDEESESQDVSQSHAGKVYQTLLNQDSSWMAQIYGLRYVSPESMAERLGMDKSSVTGVSHLNGVPLAGEGSSQVIPSWNRFNVTFRNGDGTPIMGHSNIKEIISLSSVYAYYHDDQSFDSFLSHASRLWNDSHSFKISISQVYYCDGECQYMKGRSEDNEAAEEGRVLTTEADTQTDSPETDFSESAGSESGAAAQENGSVSSPPVQSSENGNSTAGQTVPNGGSSSGEQDSGVGTSSEEIIIGKKENTEIFLNRHEIVRSFSTQQNGETGETTAEGTADTPENTQTDITVGESGESSSQNDSGESSEETTPVRETADIYMRQNDYEPADVAMLKMAEESRKAAEESAAQESAASSQQETESGENSAAVEGKTSSSESQNYDSRYCKGHVDLNVSAVVIGLDETKKSLYTCMDALVASEKSMASNEWNGWDEESRGFVKAITDQDWYAEYGLNSRESIFVQNPLSGSEVAFYMNLLPEDTSPKRRQVVEQALLSIGSIPYYWGGKPSGPGFEVNGFGRVVAPDEDGRILKGLDCSGWINWVYWTTFGTSLPAESTSGLRSCGRGIEKKDLKAGDILIRGGDMPHVYLFLAWAHDGSMYLIHETTGNANNVTIGMYDLNLPYYRCLINEE